MPDNAIFLDSNVIIYAYSDDDRKKDGGNRGNLPIFLF